MPARSSASWACVRSTIAVSTDRPSAAEVRCTTLLNALARLTSAGGTAAMPPVMIGIMPRPMPNARRQSSQTRCAWVVSRVSTCIS